MDSFVHIKTEVTSLTVAYPAVVHSELMVKWQGSAPHPDPPTVTHPPLPRCIFFGSLGVWGPCIGMALLADVISGAQTNNRPGDSLELTRPPNLQHSNAISRPGWQIMGEGGCFNGLASVGIKRVGGKYYSTIPGLSFFGLIRASTSLFLCCALQ